MHFNIYGFSQYDLKMEEYPISRDRNYSRNLQISENCLEKALKLNAMLFLC